MGIVSRFERRLQGAVGDAFARVFGGSVVPQEVEAALQREAIDQVTELDGGHLLAPNSYVITISRSDLQGLDADEELGSRTFAKHLQDYIREQGWQTYGEVHVEFRASPTLHTGQFRTRGRVDPDAGRRDPPDRRPPDRPGQPAQRTAHPQPGAGPMTQNSGYDPSREHAESDPRNRGYAPPGRPPGPGPYDYGRGGHYPGAGDYAAPEAHQAYGDYQNGYDYQPAPPGYGPPPQAYGDPRYAQPPYDQGGYPPPGYADQGYGQQAGYDQGYAQQGGYDQGYADQGYDQGYGQQGYPNQDYGQAYGQAPAGYDQAYAPPGYGPPPGYDQGYADPGYDQGGYPPPGYAPQGYAEPGYGPQGGYAPAPPQQPPRGGSGFSATLQLDDGSGRTYQLREGSNIIGRGQDAHFRLPDTGVSRRHIEVRWDGQVAMLSDLGSTNGTLVNGSPVQDWQLADGDVIRAGHSEIMIQIV